MSATRPGPRIVARKLVHRLRSRGTREVLDLGLGRVKEAISSHETLTFFVRDASGEMPSRDDATFRSTTHADAAAYARDVGTDTETTFVSRLSGSTDCFIVESEGRIVHATWVAREPSWVREIQRYFVPPPNDAYIYESYTRPEVRGRGIYPFAIASLASTLGNEGTSRLWVGVEGHNPASNKSVSKAGFETAFNLSYSRKLARLHLDPPTGPMAGVTPNVIKTSPTGA